MMRQLLCCRQNGTGKPDVTGRVLSFGRRRDSSTGAFGVSRLRSLGDRSGICCALSLVKLGNLGTFGC